MISQQRERRAWVVGTGLIGGSIGMGLRGQGWHVSGTDMDAQRAKDALVRGALDAVGEDASAEVVFVCVPAGDTVPVVLGCLARSPGAVVTDTAGVKATIVGSVADPRFVGGHPMAGSEKEGIAGVDARLFVDRTWVLSPTEHTDPEAFATLHGVIGSLGARPLAMSPERHDALVALVSHVPHLVAATLMDLAGDEAEESAEVLALAAGGFRDMTRVATGAPDIWPGVCAGNSLAIVDTLEELAARLSRVALMVKSGDSGALLTFLGRARAARSTLPTGFTAPETVAEVRVAVKDRPGTLAEVTTLAASMSVNVEDVEIAHSPGGGGGVLVMVVDSGDAAKLVHGLASLGYDAELRGL